jgi:hypothetical protein
MNIWKVDVLTIAQSITTHLVVIPAMEFTMSEPIYTRRVNAHSVPTLLNLFSVNRPRAFFHYSMEYSKNAHSLDVMALERTTCC